uniref:Anaphase-promoting complex subunit 13 n=1 Tax=Strongyloides venezuelensis TaxID=75913 RepID=A0A0K0FMG7_STRVS
MSSATDTNPRGILINHGKNHNSDHHNVTFTDKDQLILVEPIEETTPDEREKILNEVIPSQWKDEIELLKCKIKEGHSGSATDAKSDDKKEEEKDDNNEMTD